MNKGANTKLTKAFDQYMEKVTKVAQQTRDKFIVPFCNQHKLNYDSLSQEFTDQTGAVYSGDLPKSVDGCLIQAIPGVPDKVLGECMKPFKYGE